MVVVFTLIQIFLTGCYVSILIWLIHGLSRLQPGDSILIPYVTVVIAARNEESLIGFCLDALIRQDYPDGHFEIIVINDRSTDSTESIIQSYLQRTTNLEMITVTRTNPEIAPKKWALQLGINQAQGEIILTTDADCIPPPGWISSMVRCFGPQVGFVAGFSPIQSKEPSLLNRLTALDSVALGGVAAGSFGGGRPLTCSGRNLGFRKSVFMELDGYQDIGQFISGDDDLFMHKVRQQNKWQMGYAAELDSVIPTRPPPTFTAFTNQRIRHASKGRHYRGRFKWGLISVYLFNLLILISLIVPRLWPVFAAVLLVKSIVEFLLISYTARLFHQQNVMKMFPIACLIHYIYVVVFGFLGFIGRFTWKKEPYSAKATV